MIREIKFRGKEIDTGEWVVGYFVGTTDSVAIIIPFEKVNYDVGYIGDSECCYCFPETIGQFTGLYDKNGNEIYEGDIVRKKEIGGYGLEDIGVVKYYEEDCRFGIDITTINKFTKRLLFTDGECSFNDGYCTIKYYNEYEVLGNIFDNPELLKSL